MTDDSDMPSVAQRTRKPRRRDDIPFVEGDRVRLNREYCTKWKIPEWKDWGSRNGTVIYSDTSRIDVLFDRVHHQRGRQVQALFTNPDLLEMVPRSEDRTRKS